MIRSIDELMTLALAGSKNPQRLSVHDLHPYQCRSTECVKDPEHNGQIFYDHAPPPHAIQRLGQKAYDTHAAKIQCPNCNIIGNVIPCVRVHYLVPDKMGRIKGSISLGTAHLRYDCLCCIGEEKPPDLFKSYSGTLDAVTCPECLSREAIRQMAENDDDEDDPDEPTDVITPSPPEN